MQKRKKLQYKISATSWNIVLHKFWVFQKLLEVVKKVANLALLVTPEDMPDKHWQENQAAHSFHWHPNRNFSTDLIFRSQQIWGDKKHDSVQLWLAVRQALS